MAQNEHKPVVTGKNKWMVFLVPAAAFLLVLVLSMWMGHSRSSDPADLTLKNFDVEGTAKTAFGTEIPKSEVASITFVSGLDAAPETAVDVSESGSGRVLLWAQENEEKLQDLFIAGDTAVFAPADASYLFGGREYYRNLKTIDFAGVLDTQFVTTMTGMFYGCSALEKLDLSHLDTAHVQAMDWMFSGCGRLTSLDLSGFHTENVMELGWMFQNCRKLESLNLSGFQIAEGAQTFLMFQNCNALETVEGSEAVKALAESER